MTQDIPYNPDNTALLDFFPARNATRPSPVVILVHGGGFTIGDETLNLATSPWKEFLENGFAVASLRYVLSPTETFLTTPPIQNNLGRAVQWFRKHAVRLDIDPDRVILYGDSAGAIMGHYIAYGPDLQVLNGTGLNAYSSRPNGLINQNGITYWPDSVNTITGAYFGTPTLATAPLQAMIESSATFLVGLQNPHLTPTFSVYFYTGDQTVPISNPHSGYWGKILDLALKAANPNANTVVRYTGNQDPIVIQELIDWVKAL